MTARPSRGWTPTNDGDALTLALRIIDAQDTIIRTHRTGSARGARTAEETVRNLTPRLRRYTNPTEEP